MASESQKWPGGPQKCSGEPEKWPGGPQKSPWRLHTHAITPEMVWRTPKMG